VWLSGALLHKSKPQIAHTWLPVDAATWGRALLDAVKGDPDRQEGRARTLVFARDVAAANQVASVLERDGLSPVLYHKGVTVEERARALEHMATAANAVMVRALPCPASCPAPPALPALPCLPALPPDLRDGATSSSPRRPPPLPAPRRPRR
jgi:hypothetical protein